MNRLAIFGFVVVGVLVLAAVFAPVISRKNYETTHSEIRNQPPSSEYWFGTDGEGRDIFSRTVYGARISLEIGFIVVMAFPGLLLAIALVAFLGSGFGKLILALCVIGWVGYARLIRGQVLKVREYDFVQAARALGAGDLRIMVVHILPNAIQPLIVQASLGMAGAVLSEASLSFLGLGVQGVPSWGKMIEEARGTETPLHDLLFPGIAIALTVLSFNFIGDGLREYLDPRQRKR